MSVAEGIPLTAMDHGDPDLFGEQMRAVQDVASKGAFTGGAAVEDFEVWSGRDLTYQDVRKTRTDVRFCYPVG